MKSDIPKKNRTTELIIGIILLFGTIFILSAYFVEDLSVRSVLLAFGIALLPQE